MRVLVTGGSGFIGTNYMELLLKEGEADILNLDNRPPRNDEHRDFWRECDMLDGSRLKRLTGEFSPTHVVHLAAKTGLNEKSLSDFAANMEGVENLLGALADAPVERAIFTSTLLVCRMGYMPKHDTDYQATTLYGQSKVEGEKIVRARGDIPYAWSIVRPISVWGPWGEEPYQNFFRAIAQGWYVHIGSGHYKRSLGYVGNITHEINRLLSAPREAVDRKTFYLADDKPADLYDMANMIRQAVGARKIHSVPLFVARTAAWCGDVLKAAGWHSVPLTSFRLNNIMTEYVFDMQSIMEISGPLPYSLKEGIEETVKWMRETGKLGA